MHLSSIAGLAAESRSRIVKLTDCAEMIKDGRLSVPWNRRVDLVSETCARNPRSTCSGKWI